jgi:hypothetical protein
MNINPAHPLSEQYRLAAKAWVEADAAANGGPQGRQPAQSQVGVGAHAVFRAAITRSNGKSGAQIMTTAAFETLDETTQNLLLAELLAWVSSGEEARSIDRLAAMRGQTTDETWASICCAAEIEPCALPVRLARETHRQ